MIRTLVLALVFAALPALAQPSAPNADRREQRVNFARGATEATVKGSIHGHQFVDHLVTARGGQTMTVTLEASHRMAFFNVIAPGSDEAFFIGSLNGLEAKERLPVDGTYTIRVFLERAAARRGEKASYSLKVGVTGAPAPVPFAKRLERGGIAFEVSAPNTPQKNEVRVKPSGLEIVNDPVAWPAEGRVVDADVGDLDGDGSPEVYVFVKGTEGRLSLVAWSANKRKSLSMINLPALDLTPGAAQGYRGGDFMMLSASQLVRTFPLHGPDGKPTGKRRQVDYKLVPGEAAWQLKVEKVSEF